MNSMATKLVSLLKHLGTRRLSIATPLATSIGFLKSWLGLEKSDLIGLVSGSVLLSMTGFFLVACEKPSDPTVAQIQQLVEIFGLLLMLWYPMFTELVRVIVNSNYLSITPLMWRVITGTTVYSLVLWTIGQYGVDTKEWIITNPDEASVVGISFLLVWFIFKLSSWTQYFYTANIERGLTAGYLVAGTTRPIRAYSVNSRQGKRPANHREKSMLTNEQQTLVNQATAVLTSAYTLEDLLATSPEQVKNFCRLHIGHLEHEMFGVLFLNNQHQLIEFKKLFRGTIDGASVHPREVAKEALLNNSAALVLTHNHPSGGCSPSDADRHITRQLIDAMGLFDIRVLDHIIVSHKTAVSFAELGEM